LVVSAMHENGALFIAARHLTVIVFIGDVPVEFSTFRDPAFPNSEQRGDDGQSFVRARGIIWLHASSLQ